MNSSEDRESGLNAQIERLRLKANLKEKLLGRALRESEMMTEKLARKQEELRDVNSRLARATELLKESFQLYVSEQVVEEILKNAEPVNLRGERKTVTIMLTDIRDFTVLAEQFEPEELVMFLNSYFSEMIDIVFEHEGTLDKFMGDAILALFGAPVSRENDPLRAVKAAIAMQKRLQELNSVWQAAGKPVIRVGIGVSTGEVIVGNIGSEKRMEYTVVGPDVNYAQRIEALTKEISADILISESTYERIEDHVLVERYGPVAIRGSALPMTVYGVLGLK